MMLTDIWMRQMCRDWGSYLDWSVFISYIPKNLNNNQSCHFYPQNHICPTSGWICKQMHVEIDPNFSCCPSNNTQSSSITWKRLIRASKICSVFYKVYQNWAQRRTKERQKLPQQSSTTEILRHYRWSEIMNSSKYHPSYLAKCDIIIIGVRDQKCNFSHYSFLTLFTHLLAPVICIPINAPLYVAKEASFNFLEDWKVYNGISSLS